jgi:pyruvate dehydrogenase E2 component (dihydrolipoamide acetyltransferase)
MAQAILMPKPGQMTEECTLIAWHKQEGDPVRRGDVLFEIETDKSTMDVEAFDDGVLLKIVAPEGAVVPVNTVCAYVGQPGEAIPDDAPAPAVPVAAAAPVDAPVQVPATSTGSSGSGQPAPASSAGGTAPPSGARLAISPRASRLAAEGGIDPRTITGTGPQGRIVERDVRAAVLAGTASNRAEPVAQAAVPPAPAPLAMTSATVATPTASDQVPGEEEPRPLSRMRRVIADRLTASWTSTPHFTVTVAADVTRLLALRQELKAAGAAVTVTDFVLAATAQTLAEFPDVNSRTDGVSIWPRARVHLGVAVSVPGGLVVPVIRDADRMTLGELHDRAADLAARARDGVLALDDMTGGTFTVSNLGMFGVEEFSAIINPGEAAILAVSSAIATPVAIGDGLAVRSVMRLTLSADHRLVDGEMGARFVGAIRRRLEDATAFRNDALSA